MSSLERRRSFLGGNGTTAEADRIGTDTSLAFVNRISPMGRLPEDLERTGAGATATCRRPPGRLPFGPELTQNMLPLRKGFICLAQV